jgi:hypothetical protein
MAHLFDCELEQWFTARSNHEKNKKDASTDKGLRKRSRKKCDRNNYRWSLVIITGGGIIFHGSRIMESADCFIIGSALIISNTVSIIYDGEWTVFQGDSAIIECVYIIKNADCCMVNCSYIITVPAPAIIAGGFDGDECICIGSVASFSKTGAA